MTGLIVEETTAGGIFSAAVVIEVSVFSGGGFTVVKTFGGSVVPDTRVVFSVDFSASTVTRRLGTFTVVGV